MFALRSLSAFTLIVALVTLHLLVAEPAHAADIPVTSPDDDGPDTLRSALSTANVAAGQDTIIIDPAVGAITLSSPLTITDAVTIQGNGTTVERAGSFTMIVVDLVTSGPVSLDGLDFEADVSTLGRAIDATSVGGDDLTITDSRFTGFHTDIGPVYYGVDYEEGGALKVESGRLSISDSTFDSNEAYDGGGAVWVGEVTGDSAITRSTFRENFSVSFDGHGGSGLSVRRVGPDATLHVFQSTFEGNGSTASRRTGFRGIALSVGTVEGAVIVDSSTFDHQYFLLPDNASGPTSGWSVGVDRLASGGSVRIVNSTFDEPALGDGVPLFVLSAGIIDDGATYTVDHSTVVGGGTLVITENHGVSRVRNTIAEGLVAPAAIVVRSGSPVKVRYSALSTGFDPSLLADGGGNQFSVDDMMLQPLADNGGPTRTMMIGPVGPAVGTGMPVALVTEPSREQRGSAFLRRLGLLDIGAVELPADLPTLPLPEPPTSSTGGAALAATGASPSTAALILGSVGVMVGGVLLAAARRRASSS